MAYTPYINLDMDGVVFDYSKQVEKVTGKPDMAGKPMLVGDWKKIASYPDFFYEMPLIPGAKEFVRKVVKDHGSRVRFLSTMPGNFVTKAIKNKRKAIRKHFGMYIPFIPVVNSPKWYYLENRGDVLVDDMSKNIDAWNAAGGNGILFQGPEDYDRVYEMLGKVRD